MSVKILIVDDNQMILTALSEHLEESGYETMLALNGREAIDLLEHEAPDMIIMDLVMPEMDGIEATKHLRTDLRFKDLPIIAFTSRSNEGQYDEFFDEYLVKPFDFDGVLKLVRKFVPDKA